MISVTKSSCSNTLPGRGFTIIELILAIVITSGVLGALWISMGQLTSAREISRERMGAYLRADAAINSIRRDLASVLRSEELFWTKLRIEDSFTQGPAGILHRDDLLIFCSRLRPIREVDYVGEGVEYETQYHITEDAAGPVLWQRRDAAPDEYYDGGGIATPLIEGVTSFNVEAYDGEQWWPSWDSDFYGLPRAVRITVIVPITDNPYEIPITLRTVVSIDRVFPPFDAVTEDEEGEGEGDTDSTGSTPPATGASSPGISNGTSSPGTASPIGGDR